MDKKGNQGNHGYLGYQGNQNQHVKTQHCILALDYLKLVFDLEDMIYNFIYCLLFLKKVKKLSKTSVLHICYLVSQKPHI